ncbi:MAG: hypothetical protein AUH71_01400 [Thaumarchaeota archaeon 13_1_40CM_4_48_7]|nr:MAG: hypothetical protein AUH71_01400 [Thaumarchaeota archaeon 13_1_40CM_4_48_7]
MDPEDRKQFLIAMYNTMWGNIDRHILVVWQSVGVLAGAITALALVEKQVFSLDLAVTLIVMVGIWQVAHVLDASWWFSRNLRIIANIERQFLTASDVREIHYYFSERRAPKMLDHQKIQLYFGSAVTGIVLLYHFYKRVMPGLCNSFVYFELRMAVPYIVFGIGLIGLFAFHRHHQKEFNKLNDLSPGKDIGPPLQSNPPTLKG